MGRYTLDKRLDVGLAQGSGVEFEVVAAIHGQWLIERSGEFTRFHEPFDQVMPTEVVVRFSANR